MTKVLGHALPPARLAHHFPPPLLFLTTCSSPSSSSSSSPLRPPLPDSSTIHTHKHKRHFRPIPVSHSHISPPPLCRRLRQAALIRQRGHSPGSLIGRLRGRLARFLTRGGGSCRNQTGGGGRGRWRWRWREGKRAGRGAASVEREQRLSARAAFSERGRQVCKAPVNIGGGGASSIQI